MPSELDLTLSALPAVTSSCRAHMAFLLKTSTCIWVSAPQTLLTGVSVVAGPALVVLTVTAGGEGGECRSGLHLYQGRG